MTRLPAVLLAAAIPFLIAAAPPASPLDPAGIDGPKRPIAFRDVPFGSSPAEVGKRLPTLEPLQQDADSLALAGVLDGRLVQLHALFTPRSKRLWKVGVVYLQPENRPFDELEAAWRREWEALSRTWGQPMQRTALFKGAVAQGQERKALAAGQGQFTATWKLADGYLACELSRYGNLVVSYEHAALSALETEERAATTRPAPEKR